MRGAPADAGAHFLGFNFYRPSPRYVAPARRGGSSGAYRKAFQPWAVFVNEPEDDMLAIAKNAWA